MYAMGITQFTHGSENVRAVAMVQTLLGNMGIAGGGVNAQRGQQNVQGSTDMAILFGNMPGYLGHPKAAAHPTLADYNRWKHRRLATGAISPNLSSACLKLSGANMLTARTIFAMIITQSWIIRSFTYRYAYGRRGSKGHDLLGGQPGSQWPSASGKRNYSASLDQQVVVDIFENETATFWKEPESIPYNCH